MTDKAKKTTPMMEQYNRLKEEYADAILFFRLGDFYEMFNEDALEAAKVLEITLTSRNKQADQPIPMCGVPHHSADQYIRRLIEAGYKVAICEQLEDPKLTKGMVKRDVVKVITPGTIMEPDSLKQKEHNFLAALIEYETIFYFVYSDVTTGDIFLTHTQSWEQISSEIQSIGPAELIIDIRQKESLLTPLQSIYQQTISPYPINSTLEPLWQLDQPSNGEVKVLSLLFSYLNYTQKQSLKYLKAVERYRLNQFLLMNYFAKKQLELTQSLRTQRKKGSLLWFLDQTKTAMGGRLLHSWIDKPLYDKAALIDRHQKVSYLLQAFFERMELIPKLRDIYDLERLISKISLASANARDLDQLRFSLRRIPAINQLLAQVNANVADNPSAFAPLAEFEELLAELDQALVDDPPISITEGNIIKDGYHELLDEYRQALNHGQDWLIDLQLREREITGIKNLKVGYNKVFGYYLELSRLQAQSLKDERYQRKQTLANSERFITDELKAMESKILDAQEKSKQLEYELFAQLRAQINQYVPQLQILARQIAELDVYCNFASLAEQENYVRAEISDHPYQYELIDSRHPVVERLVGQAEFVANDLWVDEQKPMLLLTGPNMSGKSTYMRQVAYAVIMNQIGSFVPAKVAKLPLVDRIFTRIGSADDISQGQSTFMVEMLETNIALKQATQHSLLLFDELGRGTATYDGMALAQGILAYIARKVKAVTIFSTHYHELTDLDQEIPYLKNIHVGASEVNGQVTFLHKILPGPADRSYGIHVAKLAGLPDDLIDYSQAKLADLEANSRSIFLGEQVEQTHLFDSAPCQAERESMKQIQESIKTLNINEMTPIEALNTLVKIKDELREEGLLDQD